MGNQNQRPNSDFIHRSIWCVEYISTISEDIYCQQLDQVNEALRRKCHDLVKRKIRVNLPHEKTRRNVEKQHKKLILFTFFILTGVIISGYSIEHYFSGRELFQNKEFKNGLMNRENGCALWRNVYRLEMRNRGFEFCIFRQSKCR